MDGIELATGMTCKTINILKKELTVKSVIHTGMNINEYCEELMFYLEQTLEWAAYAIEPLQLESLKMLMNCAK